MAVMLLQGWEGAIIMTFALVASLVGILNSPAFASASIFTKEIFTFVISLLLFGRKYLRKVLRKGLTKVGFKYSIAFIIGSSIGNIFYTLALFLGGPGYGTVLTAMYPIFTAILVRIFFKEKSTPIAIIGIIITVLSGAVFVSLPALINHSNNHSSFDSTKIIGISLGAVAALCWSLEGVILSHINRNHPSWNDRELAIWKSMVSFVFILIVLLPITMSFGNSFEYVGDILSSWKSILISLALGINLVILRVLYTKSISLAGVRITSIIDTNNFIVTPIISTIIYYTSKITKLDGSGYIYEPTEWWAWLLIVPLLFGILLVILFNKHDDEIEIIDHEK